MGVESKKKKRALLIALRARFASFGYAFRGIKELVAEQPNAKIHLIVASMVILAGFLLDISTMEWLVIILSIALVFAAEAFNTALEYLTDLVSPNFHPLAGKTKDVAAGAVLITAIGTAIVGLVVFLPKLLALFTN